MPAAAPFRFLPAEVQEMEARLQPLQNPSPNQVAMEELARKFSASAERIGKVVIHPKQVRAVVQVMSEDWGRIPHLDFNQNSSRLTQIWVLARRLGLGSATGATVRVRARPPGQRRHRRNHLPVGLGPPITLLVGVSASASVCAFHRYTRIILTRALTIPCLYLHVHFF